MRKLAPASQEQQQPTAQGPSRRRTRVLKTKGGGIEYLPAHTLCTGPKPGGEQKQPAAWAISSQGLKGPIRMTPGSSLPLSGLECPSVKRVVCGPVKGLIRAGHGGARL